MFTHFFAADTADLPTQQHAVLLLVIGSIAMLAVGLAGMAFRSSIIQRTRARLLSESLSRARAATLRRIHFLNAISHDLRTPLNGIVLQTHIIEQASAAGDRPTVESALADVRHASDSAANILNALLQYAQADSEENNVAEFCLKQLIAEVADPFRAAAEEKKLAFTLSLPETLPIRSDRAKLQRILINLIDNAVKFTDSGTIAIRVTHLDAGQVEIVVTDTGPGLAPEHLKKMFEEFYQVNNPSRNPRLGLGLGLAVAHRLSDQLGGTLNAESDVGKGTTFRVRLPQDLHAVTMN